ncbi:MAG: triose-phosphate isomerase [Bacteroidia bacterium]|nr:triose-phosphate isomerase [Bacteroidia bacterium]
MRKKIVAGNWKMNTDIREGITLAKEVNRLIAENHVSYTTVILSPPFTHLTEIVKSVNLNRISVSAQNCSSEPKGAFTGEVSANMIKSTGCTHVIIGHSERRTYFKEDNFLLNKKVKHALQNDLIPIFCIGEILKEREEGKLFEVVKTQLEEGLFNLSREEFSNVVIAYEPVWAIGTGITATPLQAQEMHAYIRKLIAEKYDAEIAENTSLLYGGSCNAGNAKDLFSQADIDGGLIGGASLKADDFYKIITSF